MRFVSPAKARRIARANAANLATLTTKAAAADTLRSALVEVATTTGAVKVPNGTTKKVNRIVTEALASV